MADLNAINLEITGTSESAQEAVKSTAAALEGLKSLAAGLSGLKFSSDSVKSITTISSAMNGIASASAALRSAGSGGFAGLNGFSDAVRQMADACKSLTQGDLQKLQTVANAMNAAATVQTGPSGAAENVRDMAKRVGSQQNIKKIGIGEAFSGLGKGTTSFIGKNVETIGKLGKAFQKSVLHSNDFVRSLARIAKYRVLRTILSSITKGATEGMRNLAMASDEARATLSQLSSGTLTLKNSMGGALYSVLASIVGVLNSIISAAVSAMNWINMLFAILGGRATFKKATSATKEYGNALGGAAGGAKALKQELMGFDEINSLTPDSGGGGGGGGGGALDYGSMFEDTPIDESLAEMVEKADFTLLGERVADKVNTALSNINWSKIQTGAGKLAMSIATFINGAVFNLDADVVGSAIAGVVNTALEFVNTFVYTVDWRGLGGKLWDFLSNAVKHINASDLGTMLAAKVNVALGTLAGFLGQSTEEWKGITNWIAGVIKGAIDNVSKDDIAAVAKGIIHGGLALITSLGESGALSSLAGTILGSITDALKDIKPEEVKAAIEAGVKEAWRIACEMLEFVLDVGSIVMNFDSAVVKGASLLAIYSILKKALPALGIKGFTSGKTFALAGAIGATIEVAVGIGDVVEGAQNGEGVSGREVAEIVAKAFEAAGFTLLTSGNVYAGAIVLGIGVVIEAFLSIKEVRNSESLLPKGAYEVGIQGAVNLTEMQTAIEMATEMGGAIENTGGAAYNARQRIDELYADGVVGVSEVTQLLTDAAFAENSFRATTALSALAQLGVIAVDTEGKIVPVVDKLTELGIVVKESDFGAIINGSEAMANAANSAISSVEDAAESVAAYKGSAEAAGNIVVGNPFADFSGSDVEDIASAAEEVGTAMQATGEQAEALYTKIVEIPSDIVYNLELNNYDKVMEDLDGLQKAIASVGEDGVSGLKSAFNGLGTWFTTNVADPITDAFDISLVTYGKKMMNTLKSGLKSVSLPKFKITWTSNTSYANVMGEQHAITIPTPSISFYAKGGFPSVGELFLANEAGPEMIGRIGNRTAVANQEQIGDAIFKYMDQHSGGKEMDPNVLAGAIVGALKSAGVGAVYLDGRMLANSINREARRSGKPAINY